MDPKNKFCGFATMVQWLTYLTFENLVLTCPRQVEGLCLRSFLPSSERVCPSKKSPVWNSATQIHIQAWYFGIVETRK
jgi:hypothetical protein